MPLLNWSKVCPGVWCAVVGSPHAVSPLSIVGAEPRREALVALGDREFPLDQQAIHALDLPGRTVLHLPLGDDEEVYGLGLQFVSLRQRGRTKYLRVNSDPVQDTGETHAPVPFYVTSGGHCVLVDTASIPTFYCGSASRRDTGRPVPTADRTTDPAWAATPLSPQVEVVVPSNGGDNNRGFKVYVFAGPTPLDAVRRYNLFCGGGALPPRWGLGYWHRVPMDFTAQQAIDEAMEHRKRGVPCDVIGLEPGWQTHTYPCSHQWSPERFPDPRAFVERMSKEGFQVNLWEHVYISPHSEIHKPLEPYAGSHSVWGGLVPDLTIPAARDIYIGKHERDHVDVGVSGYKLDECDGSELTWASWMFPGHATFPSGLDGEQMRQILGLLLQRLTAEMFRKRDRRTYGLVRASNAGSSSLPFVLYSDLYDHKRFVRALCNASFCGLLWTPEVRGASGPEDWVRRFQVDCFSPLLMLNAWADRTKAWGFEPVAGIVKKYIEMRMRLLPYLYSAFARYWAEGVPPMRAMQIDAPPTSKEEADALRGIDDQFYVGDSLLVAPMFAGETMRKVYLPRGDWYEFESGNKVEGGRWITIYPGLDIIPVYVRDGGIVPLMPVMPHAPRKGQSVELEVLHFGKAPASFLLFDDDGETFAFERGQFRWRELKIERSTDGSKRGSISASETGWKSWIGEVTWRFV